MKKSILKLLTVLILLTALPASPGWVRDLRDKPKENTETASDLKITGKSVEISSAGYYSLKLVTVS